jgi:hypothetical protein
MASSSSQRRTGAVASERPRLDPGIALPLAALRVEVVLQHLEGADQRAGFAIGPQAHVHAEDLAVLGGVGDGVDQGTAESGEVFEVGNRPLPVGVAILGVDEDQVDVGGDIELAPAELAHSDHDHLLDAAVGPARRAVAVDQPPAEDLDRAYHGEFGDLRHALDHFAQGGKAGQVAGSNAGIGALLELAQHLFQIGLGHRLRGKPGRQFGGAYRLRERGFDFGCESGPGGQQAPQVTGCFRDIGKRVHRLEFIRYAPRSSILAWARRSPHEPSPSFPACFPVCACFREPTPGSRLCCARCCGRRPWPISPSPCC